MSKHSRETIDREWSRGFLTLKVVFSREHRAFVRVVLPGATWLKNRVLR